MGKKKEMADNRDIKKEELSDEDLEEVAGGISLGDPSLTGQVRRSARGAGNSEAFSFVKPEGKDSSKMFSQDSLS